MDENGTLFEAFFEIFIIFRVIHRKSKIFRKFYGENAIKRITINVGNFFFSLVYYFNAFINTISLQTISGKDYAPLVIVDTKLRR